MKKRYLTILISAFLTASTLLGYIEVPADEVETTDEYTLNINTDEKLFDVSDMLTGLFFEDINHGADGGLYAELVENRSFESNDPLNSWEASDGSAIEISNKKPLNSNNPNYAEVTCSSNDTAVKISNDGYKGITVKKGEKYDFSFWARNISAGKSVTIQLEDEDGNIISEVKNVNKVSKKWTKHEGQIKAKKSTSNAKLIVSIKKKGTVALDMISLFPQATWKDRQYGLREDLVQKIAELDPKFLRFPGGCVIEGGVQEEMYNWKNTIGNVEERKETDNLWGYDQSYGLGFYEYFQLCEDIGAVPVPVVNVGMTCQGGAHNGVSNYMASVGEELDLYIQDALDLIEYANGDKSTKWGKKRIESGHKKPFNMKYLAVGNEQWGEDYHVRFEEFQKVINEKYPEITLISAAGPIADGPLINDAWNWIKEKAPDTVVDEHYYMEPDWFLNNTDRYDDYDRNGPQVFLGEYASKSNTLKSALAEGAYLTGLEENSDIVKMASYAPLFAKADDYQWSPNMIWFDGSTNYATPNYYVQKLFSTNLGTQMLKQDLVKPEVTINNDITGGIVLGSWLTQVEYDNVKVTNNDTGETIFSDSFDSENSEWNKLTGNWTVKDGKLVLNQQTADCRIQTKSANWRNYTFEVDAKKNGGNEGFLVGFGAKDNSNYYWLNIGGWNNTSTAIEKAVNGGKATISQAAARFGKVSTGQEYKIKIVVSGNKISCYINDQLTNEVTEQARNTDVYTSTSYDSKAKELIIKVVNVDGKDKNVKINIDGKQKISSTANVEYITGEDSNIENSFENPEAISIKTKKIDNVSKSFNYSADKYSVSVIRVKLK